MRYALREDRVAVSEAVMAELLDVLHRPGLARFVEPALRAELLMSQLFAFAAWRRLRGRCSWPDMSP